MSTRQRQNLWLKSNDYVRKHRLLRARSFEDFSEATVQAKVSWVIAGGVALLISLVCAWLLFANPFGAKTPGASPSMPEWSATGLIEGRGLAMNSGTIRNRESRFLFWKPAAPEAAQLLLMAQRVDDSAGISRGDSLILVALGDRAEALSLVRRTGTQALAHFHVDDMRDVQGNPAFAMENDVTLIEYSSYGEEVERFVGKADVMFALRN